MIDVFVVGGGPAGATAAALLAARGKRVVLAEKEEFPRFHIGESLLPMALPVLEQIGVHLDDGPFVRKAGAEFMDEATGRHTWFRFSEALPGVPDHAFQVERAPFDATLLAAAASAGAEVHQGERVTHIELEDSHVAVHTDRGSYRARYLVDASGQQLFLALRDKAVRPWRDFGRAASFTHFANLSETAATELYKDGNVIVLHLPDGWGWIIPLHGRKLSVGHVLRQGIASSDRIEKTISESPLLTRLTQGATRLDLRLCGDYSYHNIHSTRARASSIGDAAAFLDPLFSSGVTLALQHALRMTELLAPALDQKREAAPQLLAPLAAELQRAYRTFYSLIHRFYHSASVDNLFLAEASDPEARRGLITILAGDVFRRDNPFQEAILKARRHRMPALEQAPSALA